MVLVLFNYMSQYIQMNSIRGLFRAKELCNYIRDGISDAFAWENRIRFRGGPRGGPWDL